MQLTPAQASQKNGLVDLLINYAASDVALSGAKPEFCTINLLAPKTTKPETIQKIMKQTCLAADELEIAIVRGHTGMYDSLTDLLGVATVYGSDSTRKANYTSKR